MPHVGPLDGRKARRKRCDACVKRRKRCHGGFPCDNCRRMNETCTFPIKSIDFTPIFVNNSNGSKAEKTRNGRSLATNVSMLLPQSMACAGSELDLPYFLTHFLPMNLFIGDKVIMGPKLCELCGTSPALVDAIRAISALHRKQLSYGSGHAPAMDALQAYGRSVRCMQNQIATGTYLNDLSALWTTFFLGLFELMRDSTGTNWLSHFLQGTCTILRLQHPKTLLGPGSHERAAFFLATRIFEISRSLIYSSPTFLSSPPWTEALARFWQTNGASLWHPKEALFDLLPKFSDLAIRALELAGTGAQLSPDTESILSQSLADEGLLLQTVLHQWWSYALTSVPDTELLIAQAYYHAISIYLSGAFDYHEQWTRPGAPEAPILQRGQIDGHVEEILKKSREMLGRGVSGVLLLFPLRVAGARANDTALRREILGLLDGTARRGFVVAEAFEGDLVELWAGRS